MAHANDDDDDYFATKQNNKTDGTYNSTSEPLKIFFQFFLPYSNLSFVILMVKFQKRDGI